MAPALADPVVGAVTPRRVWPLPLCVRVPGPPWTAHIANGLASSTLGYWVVMSPWSVWVANLLRINVRSSARRQYLQKRTTRDCSHLHHLLHRIIPPQVQDEMGLIESHPMFSCELVRDRACCRIAHSLNIRRDSCWPVFCI